MRSRKQKAAKKAAEAYAHPNARVSLRLVVLLLGRAPALVAAASAEGDNLPDTLFDELRRWRLDFESQVPSEVIETAVAGVLPGAPPAMLADITEVFAPQVVAACAAAIRLFDKHIVSQLDLLRLRPLYTPRVLKRSYAATELTRLFFGMAQTENVAPVRTEFPMYVANVINIQKHGTQSEKDALLDTRRYWLLHKGEWPNLFHVATYWLNFNTSSIEAERSFAKLRSLAAPCRLCALPETWARQLAFTCNINVVDALLADAMATLDV